MYFTSDVEKSRNCPTQKFLSSDPFCFLKKSGNPNYSELTRIIFRGHRNLIHPAILYVLLMIDSQWYTSNYGNDSDHLLANHL
jgi:hypothetical protein